MFLGYVMSFRSIFGYFLDKNNLLILNLQPLKEFCKADIYFWTKRKKQHCVFEGEQLLMVKYIHGTIVKLNVPTFPYSFNANIKCCAVVYNK